MRGWSQPPLTRTPTERTQPIFGGGKEWRMIEGPNAGQLGWSDGRIPAALAERGMMDGRRRLDAVDDDEILLEWSASP